MVCPIMAKTARKVSRSVRSGTLMPDLPSGTVTFLFTDFEGSTALWERDRATMEAAVERHLDLLRVAIAAQGGVGVLFKTVGTRPDRLPRRVRHRCRGSCRPTRG